MQRSSTFPFYLLVLALCWTGTLSAQEKTDTVPGSVDPALVNIMNTSVPKEYVIAAVKVTGTKRYDEQLLVSIGGINVGDKVMIPGGDNFSKAITNLWNQRLFSNVRIYFTKLEGNNLSIEINVTERPALSKYFLKGIKKSEDDELRQKTGLVPARVVTENVKITAIENIQKYYTEKGFQSARVTIDEAPDPAIPNSVILTFNIQKGNKVRINDIRISGNENVNQLKIKKQMKGTKEMTRMTLYPDKDTTGAAEFKHMTFNEWFGSWGFLSMSKTKDFLDPYFRFKLFSSAKYNEKKFDEDKEKILDYYNSLGYRDAAI